MNIEKDLKKDGIEVIEPLDTASVNLVAQAVSKKLSNSFPEHNLKYNNLFIKLSRLNMYKAKIPEGFAEANYLYKNSSIYFKENTNFSKISNTAIHECIHYLQEVRDKKNNLVRLGLCDFSEFKVYGLALNEGAVQLMSSIATKNDLETSKYYEISLPSISPNFYPIICNLVNQMAYVTGNYALFNSTLYGTDEFKNKFISLCDEKSFFTIQDKLDLILNLESKEIELSNLLVDVDCTDKYVQKITKKICKTKEAIKQTFIYTQNLILTSYFDTSIMNLSSIEDIENYRRKLYNFKDIIGITDDYSFFNDYYIQKMSALDDKLNLIENSTYTLALTTISNNKLVKLFNSIKNLFKANNYKKEENRL